MWAILTHLLPLFLFYTPENIRQLLVFWCFQGVWELSGDMKWINASVLLTIKFLNSLNAKQMLIFRSSPPEIFPWKDVLKICSKFTKEHPYRSVISIKMLCNFIEITLWRGCSLVTLLHAFRVPFSKNPSGGLLLYFPVVVNPWQIQTTDGKKTKETEAQNDCLSKETLNIWFCMYSKTLSLMKFLFSTWYFGILLFLSLFEHEIYLKYGSF